MTLRDEIKSLKQGRRELRSFGLLVGGILLAIGGYALWRGSAAAWPALCAGGGLVLAGALFPAHLRWPHLAWMTLAFILGRVVSTVLLVILYFGLVTPIGLVARLLGRDFLAQKWKPDATTYWEPRGVERSRREDQF